MKASPAGPRTVKETVLEGREGRVPCPDRSSVIVSLTGGSSARLLIGGSGWQSMPKTGKVCFGR
jgi:hypothetical protein